MKRQPIITKEQQNVIDQLPALNLETIASVVRNDWRNVYFGAVPYLDALGSMDKISDAYYCDSGSSVVAYFLANSNSYRGPVARAVKAELNKRLKACRY